jgi:hypothetical protein
MGGAGAGGPAGGRAGRPASVAVVAASFGEGGFEQAPIVEAKPTLPASRSTWRRLTKSGWSGSSMVTKYRRLLDVAFGMARGGIAPESHVVLLAVVVFIFNRVAESPSTDEQRRRSPRSDEQVTRCGAKSS